MYKKVLILSGSPRNGGNSDFLCDEFQRGAEESGHQVEKSGWQKRTFIPVLPVIIVGITEMSVYSKTI